MIRNTKQMKRAKKCTKMIKKSLCLTRRNGKRFILIVPEVSSHLKSIPKPADPISTGNTLQLSSPPFINKAVGPVGSSRSLSTGGLEGDEDTKWESEEVEALIQEGKSKHKPRRQIINIFSPAKLVLPTTHHAPKDELPGDNSADRLAEWMRNVESRSSLFFSS